jgi:hypothetical protein
MEDFYRKWLKQHQEDNEKARQSLNLNLIRDEEHSNNNNEDATLEDQSTSRQQSVNLDSNKILPLTPDLSKNIVYQNDKMQLYIENGTHKHQIKFRLQDHLFYIKIKLIDNSAEPPLLRDILEFLEMAFHHVLTHIRKFYKEEDHNVAFLTLYQKPMISGLNTGTYFSFFTKILFLNYYVNILSEND